MAFLGLLIIPLIICGISFILGKHHVTLQEALIHLAIQVFIAIASILIIFSANTSDIEIINGKVISKDRNEVWCEHSYRCRCREVCSGSGEDRSCHEECDTCYEHSYDVDWNLHTDVNHSTNIINIHRVDRQGLTEPNRWTIAKIGDPVAIRSSYTNYIKGASDTLFKYKSELEKYKNFLPQYPSDIYDYHYLDRVILINTSLKEPLSEWNSLIQQVNSNLGVQKQVNIILIITKGLSPDYYYALQQHWIGGKKNDAIIIIDINKDYDIIWTNVIAWTNNNIFQVKLRDALLDLKKLDQEKVILTIEEITHKYYSRRSMSDFEYLKKSIKPSFKQLLIAGIFGILSSLGLAIYFNQNEIKY